MDGALSFVAGQGWAVQFNAWPKLRTWPSIPEIKAREDSKVHT